MIKRVAGEVEMRYNIKILMVAWMLCIAAIVNLILMMRDYWETATSCATLPINTIPILLRILLSIILAIIAQIFFHKYEEFK